MRAEMDNFEAGTSNEFILEGLYDEDDKYYHVTFTVLKKMADTIKKNYYKAHRKQYNLKGFRKGKAPRKQVEQMMGGEKAIYSMAFGIYGTEKILEHCTNRVIHITSQDTEYLDNGDWRLTCKVFTEHPLGDPDSLVDMSFQIPKINPIDYVDHRVENFKKLNPYLRVKDGITEEGNMVEVSVAAEIDGEEFKPACVEATNIRVIEGAVQPPSLYDELLGSQAGDNFDIETDNVKELSGRFGAKIEGKVFLMKVNVVRVYTCQEPEVDDDLAISAGFNSLSEWVSNLSDSAIRITQGREEQLKRQLVIDHIEKCDHPNFPFEWGAEKAVEISKNNQVDVNYIKQLCQVSRQLTILRLVGSCLGIEWEDADEDMYKRDDNAYAEKVLRYLIEEKANFVHVDPGTEGDSEEDRVDGGEEGSPPPDGETLGQTVQSQI